MKNKLSLSHYGGLSISAGIRKMVLLLLVLSAGYSTAQTTHVRGLTDAEFQKAKQLYLDMMQSDTDKEMRQNIVFIVNRSNGVELPQLDASWKELNDAALNRIYKERVIAWAKANRKKMKFKSAKEAYTAVIKGVELARRGGEENKELYSLMRRADKAQLSEIMKPEKIF